MPSGHGQWAVCHGGYGGYCTNASSECNGKDKNEICQPIQAEKRARLHETVQNRIILLYKMATDDGLCLHLGSLQLHQLLYPVPDSRVRNWRIPPIQEVRDLVTLLESPPGYQGLGHADPSEGYFSASGTGRPWLTSPCKCDQIPKSPGVMNSNPGLGCESNSN